MKCWSIEETFRKKFSERKKNVKFIQMNEWKKTLQKLKILFKNVQQGLLGKN